MANYQELEKEYNELQTRKAELLNWKMAEGDNKEKAEKFLKR